MTVQNLIDFFSFSFFLSFFGPIFSVPLISFQQYLVHGPDVLQLLFSVNCYFTLNSVHGINEVFKIKIKRVSVLAFLWSFQPHPPKIFFSFFSQNSANIHNVFVTPCMILMQIRFVLM